MEILTDSLGSLRIGDNPRKTITAYKLMRLVDGKLYPLYIDRSEPVAIGVWYNADSVSKTTLESLDFGYHLIALRSEQVIKSRQRKPSLDQVKRATAHNWRWFYVVQQKTKIGYKNVGIAESNSREEVKADYALRPGWHCGSLPVMNQIGKGANHNLRDDSFVWTEIEISADVDYNAEAKANGGELYYIPTDGYYLKCTNANKKAAQADKMDWYIAGAIKINRIISDSEARQIIDRYNREHGTKIAYDYQRESGKQFNADTMQLEGCLNGTNDFYALFSDDNDLLVDFGVGWNRRDVRRKAVEYMKEHNIQSAFIEITDCEGEIKDTIDIDLGLQGTKKAPRKQTDSWYIDKLRHKFFMQLVTKARVKVEVAQELSLMAVDAMVEFGQWKNRQYESPENTTDRLKAHEILCRITDKLLDKRIIAKAEAVLAIGDMIRDCLLDFAKWKDKQHDKGLQGNEQSEPYGTKNKKVVVNGEPITIRYRGFATGEPYNVHKLRYGQSFDQDFLVFIDGKTYTAVRHWTNNGGGYTERWTYNGISVSSEKKLAELILSENELEGCGLGFAQFRISKDEKAFDENLKEAVEKKGIVRNDLNSIEFPIISVDLINRKFNNKELIDYAISENIIGEHPMIVGDSVGVVNISKSTFTKALSNVAVAKSYSRVHQITVLLNLKNIINNSIDVEIHPDYIKKDGERLPENGHTPDILMHRLYSAAEIDKSLFRIKTTIKEYRNEFLPKPYTFEITKIELFVPEANHDRHTSPLAYPNNSISATILLKNVEKSYDKGVFLIKNQNNTLSGANDNDNFKRWFSGSKVVDADGKPLVVYHGTNAEFDTFDVAKFGLWNNGTKWDFEENKPLKDKGFFFTANKTAAKEHAEGAVEWAGGKPIVLEVYLRIEKPLIVQVDKFKAQRGYDSQQWFDMWSSKLLHQYEAGDYDGIIVNNPIDDNDKLFVVFAPNQIKSATANNGNFSTESDSILEGISGTQGLGYNDWDGPEVGDWFSDKYNNTYFRIDEVRNATNHSPLSYKVWEYNVDDSFYAIGTKTYDDVKYCTLIDAPQWYTDGKANNYRLAVEYFKQHTSEDAIEDWLSAPAWTESGTDDRYIIGISLSRHEVVTAYQEAQKELAEKEKQPEADYYKPTRYLRSDHVIYHNLVWVVATVNRDGTIAIGRRHRPDSDKMIWEDVDASQLEPAYKGIPKFKIDDIVKMPDGKIAHIEHIFIRKDRFVYGVWVQDENGYQQNHYYDYEENQLTFIERPNADDKAKRIRIAKAKAKAALALLELMNIDRKAYTIKNFYQIAIDYINELAETDEYKDKRLRAEIKDGRVFVSGKRGSATKQLGHFYMYPTAKDSVMYQEHGCDYSHMWQTNKAGGSSALNSKKDDVEKEIKHCIDDILKYNYDERYN